ncbi:hypothetical protein CS022_23395 [Veronia nyctiphanis]|uniref:AB hydrolase-1 domain-containing protein n=1 Tax=Veronia nyctiphanis TaxID=1278244 RepID=A0A4Q0YI91_9GAMM|nr:alpha/beta hydrolase [Veronia nyctiphanis]RXJ70420.1 hypothetical protein CS022_23395 [Veronia nyctiphanis]
MQNIVTQDNRKLFFQYERNEGKPRLIFESGLGDDSTVWNDVIDLVKNDFSYLTYDRAGLGKSDLPSFAQSAKTAFLDLKQIIDSQELEPPFIFVGHSFGGPLIKRYVEFLASKEVGLVFVDSSDENYLEMMFAHRNEEQSEYWRKRMETPPPEELVGVNREARTSKEVIHSAAKANRFKDFPAINLVCDNVMHLDLTNKSSSYFDDKLAPYDILVQDNLGWVELHKRWEVVCPHLKVEVVSDCSHYIQKQHPTKVAESIFRVAECITNGKRL